MRAGSKLAIVGALLMAMSFAPAADARLPGETQIRAIKLLRPTQGPDEGKLVAWVRVHHALAKGRASRKASHRGRIAVDLESGGNVISRSGKKELLVDENEHLDEHQVGYLLRFPARKLDGLAKSPSDRVKVAVDARQRLDLDGDGDFESNKTDRKAVALSPKPVSEVHAPPPGRYSNISEPDTQSFDLDGYFFVEADHAYSVSGRVTKLDGGPSSPGYVCDYGVGDDEGKADGVINPVTGDFKFTFVDGTMTGTFTGGTTFDADLHDVTGTKIEDFGGGPCPPVDLTGMQFDPDPFT